MKDGGNSREDVKTELDYSFSVNRVDTEAISTHYSFNDLPVKDGERHFPYKLWLFVPFLVVVNLL
jgi:hypothetical protein